jgi:hypothetical protein
MMSLRKALGEMALLSSNSLLGGPVGKRCDSKASLSVCKDREAVVKNIHVICLFDRDHVAGTLSVRGTCHIPWQLTCITKVLSRPLFAKGLEGL